MAYITRVEGLIPVGVSFMAPSLGISAQCTSITRHCPLNQEDFFPTNCTGYPEITLFSEQQLAVYADQWSGSAVKNPFKAFWQVQLPGQLGNYQFADLLLGNTIYLIMACNFTVYDIILHYTNGSYTLINKTFASGATAAYATYPLYNDKENNDDMEIQINETFPILPRLQSDLVEINPSAANFTAIFSPDVARMLLAFSAGVLQSAPATQVTEDGIVTRYQFTPLAIYLFFVYLYALLALRIFVWAASTGRPSGTVGAKKQVRGYRPVFIDSGNAPGDESPGQAQELAIKAQWHISRPSSLVAALFGGSRKEEGRHDVDIDAWGEQANDKRVTAGLREQTEEDGSNKRMVYGVWEVTKGFKEDK